MRVKVYVLVLILITVPLSGCISNGETGTPGMDGPDGLTPLVISSTEGPGSNCAEGGIVLEVGLDLDSDSILESNEIESRTFVCNGESAEESRNGIDGLDGEDGIDGLEGLTPLVISSSEESGSNCAEGGIVLEVGLDLDSDGVLDIDEIHSRTFVCNGSSGEDGSNATSSSNTMLTRVIENLFSPECDPSSRIVEQGLDNGDGNGTAGNGLLEQDEVDYRTKYCSSTELMVQPIFSGQREMSVLSEFDTDFYFYMSGNPDPGIYRHNSTDNTTLKLSSVNIDRIYSFDENDTGFYYYSSDGFFGRFEYSNNTAWNIASLLSTIGNLYIVIADQWSERVLFKISGGSNYNLVFILDTNNHSMQVFPGMGSTGYISKWGDYILVSGRGGLAEQYENVMFRYNVQEKTSNVTHSSDSTSFFWASWTATMGQFGSKSILRYAPSQGTGHGTFGYDFTTNLIWKISDNKFEYGTYQHNPVIYGDRIFGKYWDQGNLSLWVFDNSNETYWPFYDESGSWNQWFAVRSDKLVFESNGYCLMHDSSNDSTWVVDINQDSEEICHYDETEYHPGFNDDSILIYKQVFGGPDPELWVYHTPNNSVWKLLDLTGDDPEGILPMSGQYGFIVTDGDFYAYNSSNATIWPIDPLGGKFTLYAYSENYILLEPYFNPNCTEPYLLVSFDWGTIITSGFYPYPSTHCTIPLAIDINENRTIFSAMNEDEKLYNIYSTWVVDYENNTSKWVANTHFQTCLFGYPCPNENMIISSYYEQESGRLLSTIFSTETQSSKVIRFDIEFEYGEPEFFASVNNQTYAKFYGPVHGWILVKLVENNIVTIS